MKQKVIAIIPAYNEQAKIASTVNKTINFVDSVLVIDDASSDRTAEIAKQNGATVISHSRNKGAGAAIRTGLKYALRRGYSIIVVLGGDDQDNPAEIPFLVAALDEGFDFVQGSRYLKGIKNQPIFRTFSTKLFTLLFQVVTGYKVTDASNGFRAFRIEIIKNIDLSPKWLNRYELEPYLLLQVLKKGYRYKEIPVSKYYSRKRGYTKMKPLISWYRICRPLLREFLKINI